MRCVGGAEAVLYPAVRVQFRLVGRGVGRMHLARRHAPSSLRTPRLVYWEVTGSDWAPLRQTVPDRHVLFSAQGRDLDRISRVCLIHSHHVYNPSGGCGPCITLNLHQCLDSKLIRKLID